MENVSISKESFTNYRYFETENILQSEPMLRVISPPKNFVTYLTLFQSDLYRINDLNCYYDSRHVFKPNYTGQFSMNFTRKGYFTFETYKLLEEEFAGRIMLEKPGCEFKFVQQEPGDGSCTVLSFTDEGYELLKDRYRLKEIAFFSNQAAFSTVIAGSAQADLLHHQILSRLFDKGVCRLEIDCLVTELVNVVLHLLPGRMPIKELSVNNIRHHLCTIERAKDYLLKYFIEDITLQQLAKHCNVSHFHFTRLFKQFCGYSPFSYLQQVRLTHAETLIRNTDLPMGDICFRSGFHRLDYFSTAFAKQFGASPTKYKLGAANRSIIFHVPIPVN